MKILKKIITLSIFGLFATFIWSSEENKQDLASSSLILSVKNQNIVVHSGQFLVEKINDKLSLTIVFKDIERRVLVSIKSEDLKLKNGNLQKKYLLNSLNNDIVFTYRSPSQSFYISSPITVIDNNKIKYIKMKDDNSINSDGFKKPVLENSEWKNLSEEERKEKRIGIQQMTEMLGSFFSVKINVISDDKVQVNFMGMTKMLGDGLSDVKKDFFKIKSNKVILPIVWIKR